MQPSFRRTSTRAYTVLAAVVALVVSQAPLLSGSQAAVAAPAIAKPVEFAGVPDFSVFNAASFDAEPVSRGAYITFYTTTPVTDEQQSFGFVDVTPHGLYVQTDNCREPGDIRKLPITYAGPSGFGGTLINTYYPNADDTGNGVLAWCEDSGDDTLTVHPAEGYGADISKTVSTIASRPGIFASGSAPAGYHLNATTGATTSFTDCAADPARCPVSTGGAQNFLILFTTGGEMWACPLTDYACDDEIRASFLLASVVDGQVGGYVEQQLTFYDYAGYLGQEQANVRIKPDTAPGEYRLKVTTPATPDTAQQLTVWLGPAN